MSDIKFGKLTIALSRIYGNNKGIKIDFNNAKIISQFNNPFKAMVRESI